MAEGGATVSTDSCGIDSGGVSGIAAGGIVEGGGEVIGRDGSGVGGTLGV